MIHKLYSIPVYHKKFIHSITDKEEIELKNFSLQCNDENYFSVNFNVLDSRNLSILKSKIEKYILDYKNNVCGISTQNFYITDSWIAKTPIGGKHLLHDHPNSIISGVYYAQTEKSYINFYNPVNLFKNFQFHFDYNLETEFNRTDWAIEIEQGDLIIFPSWLQHYVNTNNSNKERTVIGFNCFVSGRLGNDRYPTRLNLNQK